MSADSPTLAVAADTVSILGVDVAAVAYEPTIERLLAAITHRDRLRVHFCTVHTVIEATRDERLRTRLNAAELVAPDGMPLVWVARLRGRRVERVCGPDVMPALLDRGRAIGARHFLYGGAPGIAERLAARMRARYPGVEFVGTYSPPFRPLTERRTRRSSGCSRRPGPTASGWDSVRRGRSTGWPSIATGSRRRSCCAVGAAFDFHAGTKRRAPRLMQRTGTEWLFRLASEPRRLIGRYVRTNTMFVWLLAQDSVSSRRRRRGSDRGTVDDGQVLRVHPGLE